MPAVLTSTYPVIAVVEPVAAQPISVETALLIILGIALVFAFKSLAHLHRRVEALHAAKAPKRSAVSSAPALTAAGADLPPEVLAVISAAVFETLGADSHIVAINPESQSPAWSLEGRRQIFGSRKVR